MWIVFAVSSAVFAALTSIFAKIGIENINSNVATAIRTLVVLIMAWIMVFLTGQHSNLGSISQRNWIFLIISGICTGLSWLCYYKALQSTEVMKVVAIDKFSIVLTLFFSALILKEAITLKMIVGIICITVGTLLLAF
ncbi:EamA family transporter [uncultured Fusobacterium sp.]|uniref:EamA family transporter n=1 Tax=uncultured Fusobacterium sp. TaxID=159267 RepID=UPI002803D3F0|nr:EamA family transporter [uncultured Fusobacterium sp.]